MAKDNIGKQDGIDVAELLRSVWNRRRFVLKVTGICLLVGLFAALFGEVRYTASSVVVPQTGGGIRGGNIQGLAAMARINLGGMEEAESISPVIYPMVVSGATFQKELMYSTITLEGHDEPVTLLDYFTGRGYRKFSLFPFLKKYTIGLPAVIMDAVRRDRGERTATAPPATDSVIHFESLTHRESRCAKMLSRRLHVDVERADGYITLSATMPEAMAAAQLAARAQKLLEDYITRFKVQKVQADLDFIEERYREAKADFEAKQRALARFQDNNLDISSAIARTRESRLSDEYNLAFALYSELARRKEQARIKVKEDTPVFTVVKPVTVPMEKSAPKRMLILVAALLAGFAAGVVLVFILPAFGSIFGIKRLQRWRT